MTNSNGQVEISVIVPCYNAVQYIERAMKSLVNQTLKENLYEIIVIDDASTDCTLDCLRKWEKMYPERVKVITYEINKKQGGARNEAMRIARGRYFAFMDVDDWIEPDALQAFYSVITKGEFDIVFGKEREDKEYCIDYTNNSNELKGTLYTKFEDIMGNDFGYFWTGVYRRELIFDNNIWFPENVFYEDIYWGRAVKLYANSVFKMDKLTHHHYYNEQSTMNTKNVSYHTDRLTTYEMVLEKYRSEDVLDEHKEMFLNQTIEIYVINSYYMFFTRMKEIPEVYGRIRENLFNYFPEWVSMYDTAKLPMVYDYLMRYIAKAAKASATDLQVFKDAVLELSN